MSTAARTALLVGATGLVGSHLLRRLLAHPVYEHVIVWARRYIALDHPKLIKMVVDFERLDQYRASLNAEDVYCALGTTIKKAGSREMFYRVDYNYPFQVAYLAQQHNAQRFSMVSALGANPRSRMFYTRVKGEVESAILQLGLRKVWFFRPSLLDGERAESRPGEKIALAIGKTIAPLLVGRWKKYRPVKAEAVAAAMVYAATEDYAPGVVESDAIARLASLAPTAPQP